MKRMIDPPEGWKYGFPKAIPDNVNQDNIDQWFLDQGYPQKLIDQSMMSPAQGASKKTMMVSKPNSTATNQKTAQHAQPSQKRKEKYGKTSKDNSKACQTFFVWIYNLFANPEQRYMHRLELCLLSPRSTV